MTSLGISNNTNCRDGEVIVFDSVYRSLDDKTKVLVFHRFQSWLFVIAYATTIALHQLKAH